jgi:hypothetical protein
MPRRALRSGTWAAGLKTPAWTGLSGSRGSEGPKTVALDFDHAARADLHRSLSDAAHMADSCGLFKAGVGRACGGQRLQYQRMSAALACQSAPAGQDRPGDASDAHSASLAGPCAVHRPRSDPGPLGADLRAAARRLGRQRHKDRAAARSGRRRGAGRAPQRIGLSEPASQQAWHDAQPEGSGGPGDLPANGEAGRRGR